MHVVEVERIDFDAGMNRLHEGYGILYAPVSGPNGCRVATFLIPPGCKFRLDEVMGVVEDEPWRMGGLNGLRPKQ